MFHSFPSIEQFRHTVKTVRDRAAYHNNVVPKLTFNGTVKLHGTNAAVGRNFYTKETWCQSREQLITPENDNAGFARWVAGNISIDVLFNVSAAVYRFINLKQDDELMIYGEWCGQGIQKGVAINQLPKMFVVFSIRVCHGDDSSTWFTPDQINDVADGLEKESGKESQIFFITKFPSWSIEIDFNEPHEVQNRLVELTKAVEEECPVGKHFGVTGVGEGIVWRCVSDWVGAENLSVKTSDLVFKVKGEKHSDTKVKKLAEVDVERVNSIREFAESVVTDHRLEKMVDKLLQTGSSLDVKFTGEFLKLVGQDVLKEESDTIEANGFDRKEVMGPVNKLAREWFMKKLDEATFG